MSRADLDQDALRAEIDQTRAELGDTLQRLAERADVKSRVRAAAAHTAQRALRAGGDPAPWLALAGAATALLAMLLVARRRGPINRRVR